jgi:hypothetical protein
MNQIIKHLWVICFFSISSISLYCQSEYKLQKPDSTFEAPYYLISNKSGISIFCDSLFQYNFLNYWTDIDNIVHGQIIDTADFSPYGSEIFVYKSDLYQDYIIIWATEHEFFSEIHLLYHKNGVITKIGYLPIIDAAESRDDQVFPIKKIKISGTESVINIFPSIPFQYEISEGNYEKYLPGQKTFIIDKRTMKLTMH